MKIQLLPGEITIVKKILQSFAYEATLFGSRAKGSARSDSDLDICLRNGDQKIPLEDMARLRELFELSDLAFIVDLVDYQNLTEPFKQAAVITGINI